MHIMYLLLIYVLIVILNLNLNFIVIILKECILLFNIYLLISMYIFNWNHES